MNSAPSSNGIWQTRRFRRSRKIGDLLLPTMQHCKRHGWRPRAPGIGWQPSLATMHLVLNALAWHLPAQAERD